ncbi:hypothetical protein [Streptomyces sp. NPDC052042]|uniref:hypothetical protein n=1 Tax=Streptomyces sp. NPDC052042 TaxID=3365683 RepID=UPI0037D19654
MVVQGEDFGRWVPAQRHGWEQLLAAQQWLLENALGLTPAEKEEAGRPVPRGQGAKWAANLAAARQFHAQKGRLKVPRKHIERLVGRVERR